MIIDSNAQSSGIEKANRVPRLFTKSESFTAPHTRLGSGSNI
jgi:hypothetical protein